MNLQTLLARLDKEKSISVSEHTVLPDGPTTYTIVAALPEFPFGKNKVVWYPLVVEAGQTEIPEVEVNAVLRRLYHLGMDFGEEILATGTTAGGDD